MAAFDFAAYSEARRQKSHFTKACDTCGTLFDAYTHATKYCQESCRPSVLSAKSWDKSPRRCVQCGSEYKPIMLSQKHCTSACSRESSRANSRKENVCECCGNQFLTRRSNQKFCGSICREKSHQQRISNVIRAKPQINPKVKSRQKKDRIPPKTNFTNFSDLNFKNEHEFHDWFNLNFSLFGIKSLVKTDRWFPDIRAEMFDGRWIDIELEYHAKNFVIHKHNPLDCDLVISFLKHANQHDVAGLPLIAIFDVSGYRACGDYDFEGRVLTPHFQEIAKFCSNLTSSLLARESVARKRDPMPCD